MNTVRLSLLLLMATFAAASPASAELRLELSLDRDTYVVGETAIASVTVRNTSSADRAIPSVVLADPIRLVDDSDRPLHLPEIYIRPIGNGHLTLAPGETRIETFELEVRGRDAAERDCPCLHEGTRRLRAFGPHGTEAEVAVQVTRGSVADQAVSSVLERARTRQLLSREERAALIVELEDIANAPRSSALAPFARQELVRQYSVSNLTHEARHAVETILRDYPDDARLVRPALIRLYNLLDSAEAKGILDRLSQEPTEAGRYAAQLLSQAALWSE